MENKRISLTNSLSNNTEGSIISFHEDFYVEQERYKYDKKNVVPHSLKLKLINIPKIEIKKKVNTKGICETSHIESEISQIVMNYDKISTKPDCKRRSILTLDEKFVNRIRIIDGKNKNKDKIYNFNTGSTNSNKSNDYSYLPSFDSNEYFEELKKNNTLHKLVFDNNYFELNEVLNKFSGCEDLLEKIVNSYDLRGNTPLLLAITLQGEKYKEDYLNIIHLLLANKADLRKPNTYDWTPVEEAIFNKDVHSLGLLIDAIYERKSKLLPDSQKQLGSFLRKSPNVYFEMKWEFDSMIPFLSSLAPSDTFRIWKNGENLRMDYSFDDFKGFKVIRVERSYIFRKKNGKYEFLLINLKDRTWHNPFESLDEIEKKLIINEILNIQQVEGDFKIKNCDIKEAKNIFGNIIYEKLNQWKAKKYNVTIKSSLKILNKKKPKILFLEKEKYFDENLEMSIIMQNRDEHNITNNIMEGFKVKNELVKKGIIDNFSSNEEKNLKANVWLTDDFPIKTDYLIKLIESLGNASEYLGKLKEFINHTDIKTILEKDGFPVKIMIPITFFLDVFVAFQGVRELKEDEIPKNLFEIPEGFVKVSRKTAQDLEHNSKMRFVVANMIK